MSVQFIQTPVGILALQDADAKLIRIAFLFGRRLAPNEKTPLELPGREQDLLESFSDSERRRIAEARYHDAYQKTDLLEQTKQELFEYFSGTRQEFNLRLNPQGTAFQRKVWHELAAVPYGSTETYGGIARRIGAPRSSRAVGMAMRENPIGIVLPCHRIISSSGKLTGYNGGLHRKSFLLDLEARHSDTIDNSAIIRRLRE